MAQFYHLAVGFYTIYGLLDDRFSGEFYPMDLKGSIQVGCMHFKGETAPICHLFTEHTESFFFLNTVCTSIKKNKTRKSLIPELCATDLDLLKGF